MRTALILVSVAAVLVSLSSFASAAPISLASAEFDSRANATQRCQLAGKHGRLHLISGGDVRPWTASVRFNHEAFAAAHGYTYQFVEGNAASPRQAYWSKVKLLLDALTAPASGDNGEHTSDWVLWIDDDIVITDLANSEMVMEWQEEMMRAGKVLSVTRDSAEFTMLNTGMILVRNTPAALQLMRELWGRGKGFLGECPQSRCLHEQQALRSMYEYGRVGSPDHYKNLIAIVPQRRMGPNEGSSKFNMNSFHRRSHFDACRGRQQDFEYDSEESKWAPGSFSCHVTGMNVHLRAQLLVECLAHAHGLNGFPTMPSMDGLDACGRPLAAAAA